MMSSDLRVVEPASTGCVATVSWRMLKTISDLKARLIPVSDPPRTRIAGADVLIALALGALAAAYSFYCFGLLDPSIYGPRFNDTWFDADQERRFNAIFDPSEARVGRTSVHPLFVLLLSPIARGLTAAQLAPLTAGHCIVAVFSFLTTALLLLALRALGLPRAIAVLFSAVFLASATFVHWFAIVESYAFAAATMSLMLFMLAGADTSRRWAWVLASAATLSITTTNFLLALTSTFCRFDLRRAFVVSAAAFVIVGVLALVQQFLYPRTNLFFMPSSVITERKALLIHPANLEIRAWTPSSNIRSFVVTSAVAPAPETGAKPLIPSRRFVNNQDSPLFSHTIAGWIALVSWLFMLVAAAHGGWVNLERRAVFAAVTLFLIGQMALHSVYGEVTFLYAGNYFPALVVFAAFGWFSPLRVPAAVAALAFVVFGGVSNFTQFEAGTRLLQTIMLER